MKSRALQDKTKETDLSISNLGKREGKLFDVGFSFSQYILCHL